MFMTEVLVLVLVLVLILANLPKLGQIDPNGLEWARAGPPPNLLAEVRLAHCRGCPF